MVPRKIQASWVFPAVLILTLFFSNCSPGPRHPVAGQARGQDLLTLLPAETSAFLVADWNRFINLKAVQKTIEEQKELSAYRKKAEAFVDLQQGVYFVAVAVVGDTKKMAENAVLLVNLKYDRSKLVPEEQQNESNLEFYEGLPYFPFIEIEQSAVVCLAFLDDSNLAIGSEQAIKKVIDVYKGKAPNLLASREKRSYLKDINLKALTFGWLTVPAGLFQAEAGDNPAFKLAEKVRYISSFSDYRQQSYNLEIKIYAGTREEHKQIGETLSGLKALGIGLSGQAPEISQALDSLEITSSERYVKVFLSLKEDLIDRLKQSFKERLAGDKKGQAEKI
ncbi:MAG: hypothetical protein ACPLRR_03025 [Candidatus Saccharicenans sp.]